MAGEGPVEFTCAGGKRKPNLTHFVLKCSTGAEIDRSMQIVSWPVGMCTSGIALIVNCMSAARLCKVPSGCVAHRCVTSRPTFAI